MTPSFNAVHLKHPNKHPIPELSGPFQITSPPGTDIWDKPPATHSFNAPIVYRTATVGTFISAKVSVSAEWKDRYDQGGLTLVIKSPDRTRWVKTGIEFEYGINNISTVAKDEWSDWSLRPLLAESTNDATIELEVVSDGSLWVWLVGSDGTKHALREVTWYGSLDKDVEVWVGVYVAKPAPNGETDDLVVNFDGLVIETQ